MHVTQYLPNKVLFCSDQIACHFLTPLNLVERLIIVIPGGPCLSGKYLEHFAYALAQRYQANVGLLSLPNHDDSYVQQDWLPLTYQYCLQLVNDMLIEVQKKVSKLILFGQSFGARLAFDLLAYSQVHLQGAFLTGFPYKFQISKNLENKLSNLVIPVDDDQEISFQKTWRSMLPFYTYFPLSLDIFESLTSNTKYLGNENILNNIPSLEKSIANLKQKQDQCNLYILQGNEDYVVPDNNTIKLQSLIPAARFFTINECGHFPMLEQTEKTLDIFGEFYGSIE